MHLSLTKAIIDFVLIVLQRLGRIFKPLMLMKRRMSAYSRRHSIFLFIFNKKVRAILACQKRGNFPNRLTLYFLDGILLNVIMYFYMILYFVNF